MLFHDKCLRYVLLALALVASPGCLSLDSAREHLALLHSYHADRHQARRDELEARAQEERLHKHACICEEEARQEQARREHIDTLRSKLSFHMDQRFVMNDLEVDAKELKELMAKRDKDYEEVKKLWAELERQMMEARTEQELAATRSKLEALTHRAVERGCCEPPPRCRCGRFCCHICEQPGRPGRPLIPELPAKRPVTPVDIPMVIKVRWRMGLESPQVEEARVRSLPAIPEMPGHLHGRPYQPCPQPPQPDCGPPPAIKGTLPKGPPAPPVGTPAYPTTSGDLQRVHTEAVGPPAPIPYMEKLPPPAG